MKFQQSLLTFLLISILTFNVQAQLGSYQPFDWYNPSQDTINIKELAQRILEEKILQENLVLTNSIHNSQQLSQFYKVTKSETQVVSGTNVYAEFTIIQPENQQNNNKSYEIIIYMQPWTNTYKVIEFNELKNEKQQENNQENLKKSEEKQHNHQIYGGINDDFNLQTSIYSNKIYELLENKLNTKNFEIIYIKSQVISGVKYYLIVKNNDNQQQYHITMISQPWNKIFYIDEFNLQNEQNENLTNKQEIIEQKENNNNDHNNTHSHKKPYFAGSIQPIDFELEDKLIKQLVYEQITGQINTKPENIKITSATKQVVSGLMYHIKFTILNLETYECDVQVQLWNKSAVITNLKKI